MKNMKVCLDSLGKGGELGIKPPACCEAPVKSMHLSGPVSPQENKVAGTRLNARQTRIRLTCVPPPAAGTVQAPAGAGSSRRRRRWPQGRSPSSAPWAAARPCSPWRSAASRPPRRGSSSSLCRGRQLRDRAVWVEERALRTSTSTSMISSEPTPRPDVDVFLLRSRPRPRGTPATPPSWSFRGGLAEWLSLPTGIPSLANRVPATGLPLTKMAGKASLRAD